MSRINFHMIRDHQMNTYILEGTYQDNNGMDRDVNLKGKSLYHCVKRLLNNDSQFNTSSQTKFRGGHIVADYDVSASVNAIAKYI